MNRLQLQSTLTWTNTLGTSSCFKDQTNSGRCLTEASLRSFKDEHCPLEVIQWEKKDVCSGIVLPSCSLFAEFS